MLSGYSRLRRHAQSIHQTVDVRLYEPETFCFKRLENEWVKLSSNLCFEDAVDGVGVGDLLGSILLLGFAHMSTQVRVRP